MTVSSVAIEKQANPSGCGETFIVQDKGRLPFFLLCCLLTIAICLLSGHYWNRFPTVAKPFVIVVDLSLIIYTYISWSPKRVIFAVGQYKFALWILPENKLGPLSFFKLKADRYLIFELNEIESIVATRVTLRYPNKGKETKQEFTSLVLRFKDRQELYKVILGYLQFDIKSQTSVDMPIVFDRGWVGYWNWTRNSNHTIEQFVQFAKGMFVEDRARFSIKNIDWDLTDCECWDMDKKVAVLTDLYYHAEKFASLTAAKSLFRLDWTTSFKVINQIKTASDIRYQ